MRSPGVHREEVFLPPPPILRTGVPAFIGLGTTGPVGFGPGTAGARFANWPRLVSLARRSLAAERGEGPPLDPSEEEALARLRQEMRLDAWSQDEHDIAREDWPTLAAALRVDGWTAFRSRFGEPPAGSHLSEAVRGFFANGGRACYVVRLDPDTAEGDPHTALAGVLDTIDEIEDTDLVCVPDLMHPAAAADPLTLQQLVLQHCELTGRRMALLDARPSATPDGVLRDARSLRSANGALYYPWVRPAPGPDGDPGFVPPCGHVAGLVARTDDRSGVHKAPANERLEGVLDVEAQISGSDQAALNSAGVNAIRAFLGRGIRVWGARTLSESAEWTYLPVRRIFLTAARWLEQTMDEPLFEPNDVQLWTRIRLRLTDYFADLHRRGALKGRSPEEAFYVRCDAATNPAAVREDGRVVAEVGLAPALPNEFVVVRITRHAGGVSITAPVPG